MNGRFGVGCLRWLPVMILWTLLSGSPLAQETAGRLVDVTGTVWTRAPHGREIPAQIGKQIAPGTRIRTGADGRAEVSFEDGSILMVQPDTAMVLSDIKRQKRKKRSILVFFGRIWNRVTAVIGTPTRYEVNTPVVVAGVRGTEFETAVADDGTARVRVLSGQVSVSGNGDVEVVAAGQELEADLRGLGPAAAAQKAPDWAQWRNARRDRLRIQGRFLIDAYKSRLLNRKEKLTALRNRQQAVEAQRKLAIDRAEGGNSQAIEQIRQYNEELITIADDIADLGDAAGSQFGLIDHFGKLARDPKFQMIDGNYVQAEAAMMRRIKAEFDEMIAAGTDISLAAMERQLIEMSGGQRGSLKFKEGSSREDLFGDEPSEDQ